jgi:hypothetical protein
MSDTEEKTEKWFLPENRASKDKTSNLFSKIVSDTIETKAVMRENFIGTVTEALENKDELGDDFHLDHTAEPFDNGLNKSSSHQINIKGSQKRFESFQEKNKYNAIQKERYQTTMTEDEGRYNKPTAATMKRKASMISLSQNFSPGNLDNFNENENNFDDITQSNHTGIGQSNHIMTKHRISEPTPLKGRDSEFEVDDNEINAFIYEKITPENAKPGQIIIKKEKEQRIDIETTTNNEQKKKTLWCCVL